MNENLKKLDTFIFDLDGTLLDSTKNIDSRTLQTIKDLQKKGKKFSINTGRTPAIAMKFMNQMEPDFPCSFCNGAVIYDWKNKKYLKNVSMDTETVNKALKILNEERSTILVYTSKAIYYKKFTDDSKLVNIIFKSNEALGNEKVTVAPIPDDFKASEHIVYKVLCGCEEILGNLGKIKEVLNTFEGYIPFQANNSIIDLIPSDSNKGTGLQFMIDHKLIDYQTTCVFGDENNDIPMFKIAKYSTCMGQARDEVKKQATFVTDTNDNNGIGKFLEKTI